MLKAATGHSARQIEDAVKVVKPKRLSKETDIDAIDRGTYEVF